MDELKQSDHKRLLDFVRDCYAIRNFEPFESFPGKFVVALSRLIPSLDASYAVLYPRTGEFNHVGSTPEISTPEVSRLLLLHMNDHFPLLHYMRTGDGSALRFSDCLSQRQFHDTGLYSDLYRHYDKEDDLCIGVCNGPARLIGIAWHSDRCFTDRERRTADLVRPYVVQAWQNAKLFSEMHSQLQVLEHGLEGAALGVIACDSEGRVRHITALARQYLAEYFGASRNLDRQLPQELLRWVRCQDAQLNKGDLPPVRLPLAMQKADNRLTVRLLTSAGANLLLLEEKTLARNSAAGDGLCLTRRESQVLSWAAQGKTNSEIADMLSMSLPTTKKHMEHILQKLGVRTRTAAAAIALQSLSRTK
jgi:DNA-binding CsgD family transcriptional regulator